MGLRKEFARSILVVDPAARASMTQELGSAGFRVLTVETAVDSQRSDRGRSRIPAILITTFAELSSAIAAIHAGAADLARLTQKAARRKSDSPPMLQSNGAEDPISLRLVGSGLNEVRERMRGLLDLRVAVLVSGESGTGRDRVIETLHELGRAAASPLRRVHAGDAELRTLADASVHLDGVEHFSPRAQRLWADHITDCESSGARVYASSSAPLELLASSGRFDAELASWLTRFSIHLPALRDRLGDLEELVPALICQRGRELGRAAIRIDAAAIARLRAQSWPGNVRELDAVVTQLVAFSANGSIDASHVEMVLAERADAVVSLRAQRDADQRVQLHQLLTECGGNFAEVARRLDLTRGAVVYRAKRFGLFHGRRFDG
jgi:DNA-binding NtrC family response regulator